MTNVFSFSGRCLLLAGSLLMLAAVPSLRAQTLLKASVVAGGGSPGTSASYRLNSTIGQGAKGPSTSANVSSGAGYWYQVVGVTVAGMLVVNAKVFLQGPYSVAASQMGTGLNSGGYLPLAQPYNTAPWNYAGAESVAPGFFAAHPTIVDWVLVELRQASGGPALAQRAAFVKADGTVVETDGVGQVAFSGLAAGSYFVVVRHRNHLGVMSASAVALAKASSALYNFTTAQAKAFGASPMIQLAAGVFGLLGGDGNASGNVNAIDRNSHWRPQNGTFGYLSGDFNLSGGANAVDRNTIWRLNNGTFTQVPAN